MPKRIVHGEAMWRSEKIARINPPKYKPEYAYLLAIALANGTFECSPIRIWSECYSFGRPEVSRNDVEKILQAFEDAGLLFRWTDGGSKQWGYWVGSDKPGRLPPRSMRKHYEVGPDPPADLLAEYIAKHSGPNAAPPKTIQEPEPLTSKRSLPADFGISDAVRKWAAENGYSELEKHFDYFVGHAKAKNYKYANWNQAFMNAIRENWAKVEQKPRSSGPTLLERTKAQLRGE